jgi:predicted secreted hydrolase
MELAVEDEPGSVVETDARAFAGSKGSAGAIFSNNFHAFCRVRGSVTLDGRTAAVDAPAWRDHSWGVRRWDSFVASRSFGGSFGESLQFRYGSMVGVNGSFFRHGSLVRDGVPVPVASAEMLVHIDDDSLRCPSAEVRYRLDSGETTSVRIDTVGGMIGATQRRYGWESVGDVSVDGAPGGWGFLEVNNNPRNGHSPPAFVLGDALTNGITHS